MPSIMSMNQQTCDISHAIPNSLPTSLKVGTLNCWGLYTSPDRPKRYQAIAQALQSLSLDIVALQEVWVTNDWTRLSAALHSLYPYTTHYPAGVVGSGLAILSKWPIVGLAWHRYSMNGAPNWITHGDWYAGKGVAVARILVDDKYLIDVYNSHTHAEYCKTSLRYIMHQLSQLCEFRRMIESFSVRNGSVEQGKQQQQKTSNGTSIVVSNSNNANLSRAPDLILAVGDWNCYSDSLPYEAVIKDGAMVSFDGHFIPLNDAWLEHHLDKVISNNNAPSNSLSSFMLNSNSYNREGCTYNSPENKYHKDKKPLERIDYIHYNALHKENSNEWGCIGTEIINKQSEVTLSDHALLIAHFGPKSTDEETVSTPTLSEADSNDDQQQFSRLTNYHRLISNYIDRDLQVLNKRKLAFRLVSILCTLVFLAMFITGAVLVIGQWGDSLLQAALLTIAPIFLVPSILCTIISEVFIKDERAGVKMLAQQWAAWYATKLFSAMKNDPVTAGEDEDDEERIVKQDATSRPLDGTENMDSPLLCQQIV